MTTDDRQAPDTALNDQPSDGGGGAVGPLEAVTQERDQFKALAQRTQADFINYKRRTEEERGAIARNASGQVLGRLLNVLDDLQRAIAVVPTDAPAAWTDGIKMVALNFQAVIEAEGVTKYEPSPGDTFDPAQHEAIHYQPSDAQPAGAVLTVERPGYRTKDRILRPAQVVVARAPEPAR